MSNNPLSILDGFENEFFGIDDSYRNFIEDFFSSVMSGFSMRNKIELVNHIKMVHQLTLINNPDLQKPFIGVLAVELVDCMYRFLLKREQPKLDYGEIEIGKMKRKVVVYWLDPCTVPQYAPNNIDYLDSNKLKEWSQSLPSRFAPKYEGNGTVFETSNTPEDYVKFFYVHKDVPIRPLSGGIPEACNSFVNAFRETLDIIASLK